MSSKLDSCSKSLPPVEFQICISSADSGIDSDASHSSSTKLHSSVEDFEVDIEVSPQSLILGEKASDKERIEGITKAMSWIRKELIKMKKTDKQLTKTMITMRSKIAEYKVRLETQRDQGYSEPNSTLTRTDTYVKEHWRLIAKDGAFPTDGLDFENNKRATWVI